jgi:hypothetical protein
VISYLSSKLGEKKSRCQRKDWNLPTLPKRTRLKSSSLVNLQGRILVRRIYILRQWTS